MLTLVFCLVRIPKHAQLELFAHSFVLLFSEPTTTISFTYSHWVTQDATKFEVRHPTPDSSASNRRRFGSTEAIN